VITGLSGSGKILPRLGHNLQPKASADTSRPFRAYARQFPRTNGAPRSRRHRRPVSIHSPRAKTTHPLPALDCRAPITEIYDYLRVILQVHRNPARVQLRQAIITASPAKNTAPAQLVQAILNGDRCRPRSHVMILPPLCGRAAKRPLIARSWKARAKAGVTSACASMATYRSERGPARPTDKPAAKNFTHRSSHRSSRIKQGIGLAPRSKSSHRTQARRWSRHTRVSIG